MEEETQRKYLELQFLENQIKQIQQQLMNIENQISELKRVDDDLSEFDKVKENSEMFFSLGPGIFAEGVVKNKELLINVGANVSVKKTIPETKKLITEQVMELEDLLGKMQQDLQLVGLKGQEIQQELINLTSQKHK